MSGLFVNMLQRLVTLSRGVAGDGVNKALKPWRTLDGFGRLGAPPAGAQMLPADADQTFKPRPTTPPGFYGDENAQVAFNIGGHVGDAQAAGAAGRRRDRPPVRGRRDRSRALVPARRRAAAAARPAALALAARADAARGAHRPRRAGRRCCSASRSSLPAPDTQAHSPAAARRRPGRPTSPGQPPLSEEQALKGSLDMRLAYIMTGDKEVDDISKAGLEGLSEILRNRTSVEPGDPVGLDLEQDEPRLYPLIYWPITSTQPNLSPRASAALDRYLRTGGILFIDTRDQQMSFDRPAGGNPDLKRLLSGIETPPLIVMPPDHVLTKSFYLLSDMPGRWVGGKLWIESGGGRVNDGVTTIVIGANDYAGAWAVDQRGRGLNPVTPGGETQREMSLPGRREPRDACADRQLQGRPGPHPGHHAEAPAMNTDLRRLRRLRSAAAAGRC